MRPSLRSRSVGSLVSDLRLGQHDPDRPALLVDHLAVLDLVLHLAQGMHAGGSAADAQFRLLGHLDLGEQGARRRIPAGEIDAGRLTDKAASAVASDEIFAPAATGRRTPRRRRRCRPARSPSLHVRDRSSPPARRPSRPGCARCGSATARARSGCRVGKSLMSSGVPANSRDLGRLPLREEPIGDSALIEDLDGACVQTACARAGEVLAGAPLDDGDVDARQRQLARQHQPRRASSGDHHRMFGHTPHPHPRRF